MAVVSGAETQAVLDELSNEIDRLNKHYGERFRILKGVESDILLDGSLDYPGEVLATFDFIVSSVHGHFKLSRKEQPQTSNPLPTSRLQPQPIRLHQFRRDEPI